MSFPDKYLTLYERMEPVIEEYLLLDKETRRNLLYDLIDIISNFMSDICYKLPLTEEERELEKELKKKKKEE